jgi:cytochrome P450
LAIDVAAAVVRHPPGPRGWPYFGCLGGLLRDPMEFWSGLANRYGGIVRVPLMAGQTAYLVSDPTLLYELLVTNRQKYRKNIRYRAAVELFGAGLLLNEGDAWKRQRLISQPVFKADYVAEQVAWMAELTAEFFERWRPKTVERRAFDVDREFLKLSQLLAGYYLMGPGFAPIAERFCAAAITIKESWPRPPRHVLHVLLRKWRGGAAGWPPDLGEAIKQIDACVYEYLAERRKQDFADSGLVTMLVKASREQRDEFDDRSLRDQVLTLFFAGHETSATSLSWIHYLLSQHTDVRAKLRAEVDRVLGKRMPTMNDLDRLPYTEQVVNESLRLYSPIHSISRVALEADTLGGYAIPAGATIYVSLYATHRLAQFWPDPERFDPERFTSAENERRPRFAFIPFAAGHRNCIGGTAAIAELKLAIAVLAQRYELDLAPGHRVQAAAGTTMYPRYGMNMLVRGV